MKKQVISILLLFIATLSAYAIHPEKLMQQLSAEREVETQTFDKEALAQMKHQYTELPGIDGVETVNVIGLEDCSEDIIQNYKSMIRTLEDVDGYETLIMVDDGEDTVRMMLKSTNDTVEEMCFFVADDEDVIIVQVLGNISQEIIDAIIQEQAKKQ